MLLLFPDQRPLCLATALILLCHASESNPSLPLLFPITPPSPFPLLLNPSSHLPPTFIRRLVLPCFHLHHLFPLSPTPFHRPVPPIAHHVTALLVFRAAQCITVDPADLLSLPIITQICGSFVVTTQAPVVSLHSIACFNFTARPIMARYGMAWHGMAWHGMAWHGMAWHDMAWHGMAWHDMAWHGCGSVAVLKAPLPRPRLLLPACCLPPAELAACDWTTSRWQQSEEARKVQRVRVNLFPHPTCAPTVSCHTNCWRVPQSPSPCHAGPDCHPLLPSSSSFCFPSRYSPLALLSTLLSTFSSVIPLPPPPQCALPSGLLQPAPLQPPGVPCTPTSDLEVRVGHALPLRAGAALRLTHRLLTSRFLHPMASSSSKHSIRPDVATPPCAAQMAGRAGRDKGALRAMMREMAQKTEKRIDSPLVRYNELGQAVCRVCTTVIKSESLWAAHLVSKQHKEVRLSLKFRLSPTPPLSIFRASSPLQSSSLRNPLPLPPPLAPFRSPSLCAFHHALPSPTPLLSRARSGSSREPRPQHRPPPLLPPVQRRDPQRQQPRQHQVAGGLLLLLLLEPSRVTSSIPHRRLNGPAMVGGWVGARWVGGVHSTFHRLFLNPCSFLILSHPSLVPPPLSCSLPPLPSSPSLLQFFASLPPDVPSATPAAAASVPANPPAATTLAVRQSSGAPASTPAAPAVCATAPASAASAAPPSTTGLPADFFDAPAPPAPPAPPAAAPAAPSAPAAAAPSSPATPATPAAPASASALPPDFFDGPSTATAAAAAAPSAPPAPAAAAAKGGKGGGGAGKGAVGREGGAGQGVLPEGFFDSKEADHRARGVEYKKPDAEEELRAFERSIKGDMEHIDERQEEEERQAREGGGDGEWGAGEGAVLNGVGRRGGGGVGEIEGGKMSVDGGEQDGEGEVGSGDGNDKGEEDGEDGSDDDDDEEEEEEAEDDEGDEDEEEEGGEEDDDIEAEIFDWRAKRL
ncbi:unnamed protein product [Closterium sp. NIES-53]